MLRKDLFLPNNNYQGLDLSFKISLQVTICQTLTNVFVIWVHVNGDRKSKKPQKITKTKHNETN